jgi:hypothetical protein
MVSYQHKTGHLSKKTESEDFPWLLNKKHEKNAIRHAEHSRTYLYLIL